MTRNATFAVALALATAVSAQTPIEEKTEGMERQDGLLTTYREAKENKLFMQIGPGQMREYLVVSAIRTGLGSNDVGLDRGRLGSSDLVRLRRIADKVVFEVPNLAFRAESESAAERRSVREAFAPSVLWATKVVAEDEDGSVLIDLTEFLMRDANDVAGTIRQAGQGTASVDGDKSAIDFEQCLSFPKNLEFEALLTFKVSTPGQYVRGTVPIPESWSLVQHVSIVELPDDGYRTREMDTRIGAFGISYLDFAVPLDRSMKRRLIARHRLQKADPTKAVSKPVEPIVYYVDSGAPEPVRQALIDGASWWAEAFREAGFEDAFRVEVMPEGAHPLDLRYNVIQWVHRSTRGWSYGASVRDPRTGEIIKGHVSLGSLRVRQDRLIFEGLLGVGKTGSGDADDPVELALARIRQLAAHEVGHTIGLAHNFAASTYGRGSVMDYPAPLVTVEGGRLDVSDAYAVGIGEYDKHAVKWMYSEFAPGADEAVELERIVRDGQRRGLLFLSDQDARSPSSADPRANLWDNGRNAVDGLRETMAVREIALKNFSRENLPEGEPLSTIQEVFVPVFLFHRYQVEAAAKAIGGVYYAHTVNGDGVRPFTHVPGGEQRDALQALLDCLVTEFLTVPTHVVQLIGPRGFGVGGSREIFGGRTGPTFDPVAASEAAADAVLAGLLNAGRLERVVQQTQRRPDLPSLSEILGATTDVVFGPAWSRRERGPVAWAVRRLYLTRLMRTAANAALTLELRAGARDELLRIRNRIDLADPKSSFVDGEIERFLFRPAGSSVEYGPAAATPPGSPIGFWQACSLGG